MIDPRESLHHYPVNDSGTRRVRDEEAEGLIMIRRQMWVAAALSVAVMGLAQAAAAQSPGFYVSGAVGTGKPVDADYTGTGVNATVESDFGYAFAAAFGYAYTSNLRSEIELAYRSSDISSITSSPAANGDISALSGMLNGYYDFRNSTPFTPYIGAGIGVARINIDANTVAVLGGTGVNDSDVVFAYQGVVGLSYAIDDQLSVFGDYHYFATVDPGFTTDAGASIDTPRIAMNMPMTSRIGRGSKSVSEASVRFEALMGCGSRAVVPVS